MLHSIHTQLTQEHNGVMIQYTVYSTAALCVNALGYCYCRKINYDSFKSQKITTKREGTGKSLSTVCLHISGFQNNCQKPSLWYRITFKMQIRIPTLLSYFFFICPSNYCMHPPPPPPSLFVHVNSLASFSKVMWEFTVLSLPFLWSQYCARNTKCQQENFLACCLT